jgi:hypothetical protein
MRVAWCPCVHAALRFAALHCAALGCAALCCAALWVAASRRCLGDMHSNNTCTPRHTCARTHARSQPRHATPRHPSPQAPATPSSFRACTCRRSWPRSTPLWPPSAAAPWASSAHCWSSRCAAFAALCACVRAWRCVCGRRVSPSVGGHSNAPWRHALHTHAHTSTLVHTRPLAACLVSLATAPTHTHTRARAPDQQHQAADPQPLPLLPGRRLPHVRPLRRLRGRPLHGRGVRVLRWQRQGDVHGLPVHRQADGHGARPTHRPLHMRRARARHVGDWHVCVLCARGWAHGAVRRSCGGCLAGWGGVLSQVVPGASAARACVVCRRGACASFAWAAQRGWLVWSCWC